MISCVWNGGWTDESRGGDCEQGRVEENGALSYASSSSRSARSTVSEVSFTVEEAFVPVRSYLF